MSTIDKAAPNASEARFEIHELPLVKKAKYVNNATNIHPVVKSSPTGIFFAILSSLDWVGIYIFLF